LTFLPGKIVHHLALDQCSLSQNLVQLILILIEFAKIHMGDHVIRNHCSWYLFTCISQGAKMKSVTMHFCRLIIGGDIAHWCFWMLFYDNIIAIRCIPVYSWLIKCCRVQSINHERCDTMESWEDSTDKLATQFHMLIFKIFSFLRRFWSRLGYTVLILSPRCLRIKASLPASQTTIGSYRSY